MWHSRLHAGLARYDLTIPSGIKCPVIGATVAGVGTYSVQTGTIKRQGKRCDITVSLTWSAHTGTGGMSIVAIPPPAADQAFVQIFCSNLVFTGQLFSRIIPSAAPSTIQLLQSASGGFTQAVPMDTAARVSIVEWRNNRNRGGNLGNLHVRQTSEHFANNSSAPSAQLFAPWFRLLPMLRYRGIPRI